MLPRPALYINNPALQHQMMGDEIKQLRETNKGNNKEVMSVFSDTVATYASLVYITSHHVVHACSYVTRLKKANNTRQSSCFCSLPLRHAWA